MTIIPAELKSIPSDSAPVAVRKKPGPKPKIHPSKFLEADFSSLAPPSSDPTFTSFIHSPDSAIRNRYASELDKNEALAELGRLRRICEMAAEEINSRLVPDESKCMMCGRELSPGQKITMMANVKDDASGIITTHPICSIECVRQYNKRRMGLAQIPDQGHVKEL